MIPNESYPNLLQQFFILAKEIGTDREEYWKYPYHEAKAMEKTITDYNKKEKEEMEAKSAELKSKTKTGN